MIKLRNGIVAVLDVGSSKIACIIARIDVSKPLVILGIGHQRSQGIRSGLIIDIKAAESVILSAVNAAEKMAGISIESVVVNLSSNLIASQTMGFNVDIGGYEITAQDISRLTEQAHANVNLQEYAILHTITHSYTIDGNTGIANPVGMYGQNLQSQVHLVTAPISVVRNLQHCLAKCSLDCQAIVAAAYASGLSALSEDERQLGSVLIDMGGGTTSIAIFENNCLIYTGSIPIGGMHITKDIARGLSTSLSYAERIKTLYGNLLSSTQDDTISIDLTQDEGSDNDQEISHIARSALVGIIRPRVEEMLELIEQHLSAHGYSSIVGYRLVLTGGTSQLTGIRELASEYFHAQTRLAKPTALEGMAESIKGPGFSSAVGLIYYVEQNQVLTALSESASSGALLPRLIRWLQQNF